ncbi:MAG: hypothetical protein KGI29_06175 [Pseudomonadota bacterium]|nr:hypothetical protein [Pseudomonadota bacterium]MDE3037934.1 hypothetical protein [Pseudomonadota bacterium]
MSQQPQGKTLLVMGLVTVIGIVGYYVLNAPDRRDDGQKIADAINALPNGVDKASRQLKDRTPGEKLGDAAKDAGDDLKKATNQQ